VRLDVDTGYEVRLFGFDLAGWLWRDYDSVSATVTGSSGVLFTQSLVHVEGDFNGPRRTSFDFGAGLADTSWILLDIDLAGVGSSYQNVGLDNVRFGQVDLTPPPPPPPPPPVGAIPEPGAWALMIIGFGGAGAMLRRRRTSTALG
jgi:hypothetical protein